MDLENPIFNALYLYTKALSVALGFRDLPTRLHSDRVQGLSEELGARCRLSKTEISSVTKTKDAGIYSALADPAVFEQATISLGVVTWPNGADLDPAWMYERLRIEKTWSVRI